jgi:hypothetical protein
MSGPWFDRRRFDDEAAMRLVDRGIGAVHHGFRCQTLGVCGGDDLVVDISDIADVRHVEAELVEIVTDHIECHSRSSVPEVRLGLDRRPTNVHADLAGVAGFELNEFPPEGVVDPHRTRCHRRTPTQPRSPRGVPRVHTAIWDVDAA